jgi:magnesium transporter
MNKASQYPKHSIAEHIVPFDLVFGLKDTVSSTIKKIEMEVSSWPNIENLFIIDANRKLLGTVEFAKLLESPPEAKLEDLATEKFTFVTEHSHQSNVAKIALKLGVENIPVVDEEGHFVGIIDANQILKILHEEHVEELMKFSGILASEEFLNMSKISFTKIVKGRLPWLIVGLFGGVAAAHIIGFFQNTLESQLILATFIPLIVYMADAIGTQTETIFVRDLAIEGHLNLKKFLLKEITVGLTIAVICGSLISLYSFLRFGSSYLGLVLGLSLFSATLIAIVVGTLVPWFINSLKYDPALGTGPLTTVIQDVASVTIYFVIASVLL